MYPKNAASPEPIAIGAVVQISDGAVQTSGCTVRIKPIGVAEGDGGGTTAYSTDGIVYYTPTQAETNYTSFILIAKKTGCIPVSVTVVTTSSATPGTVLLAPVTHTSAVVPTVSTLTGHTPQTGDSYARIGAAGAGLTALGDTRIANLDATVSSRGTSTLTQTQVSGGAYALSSASFVCGDTRLANLDATISSRGTSTLTQTQVTGGAYSLSSASFVCGDTRIANLDAAVTSRMATYTQPTGFLAATFPTTVASTTNITAATGIDVTKWNGTAVATPNTAGRPLVDVRNLYDTNDAVYRPLFVDSTGSVQVGSLGGTVVGDIGTGVWLNGSRTLTAIDEDSTTLDLDATIRAAMGLASANLDTQIGTLATQTSVNTVSTNLSSLITTVGVAGAGLSAVPWNASWDAEVQSEVTDALEATVADSVPADGSRPSISQAVYMIVQALTEGGISGTTWTVKKPDGTTTLFTVTLDSATTPTSKTRAS